MKPEQIPLLRDRGMALKYPDPQVPIFMAETIAAHDPVAIVTNHAAFDYDLIRRKAQTDRRCGVYLDPASNVVKA